MCSSDLDYNRNGVIDNAEHPANYSQVTETLENQNFIIIKRSTNCPTGGLATATVLHQS